MQMLTEPHLAFLFLGGIFGIIFALVTTIFVIWMFIDALLNAALNGTEKIIWLLVIFFLHFLGALLYYFLARGGRRRPLV